jgi:hypothetical protein
VPSIQFPVLLLAWYFTRDDPALQEQQSPRLPAKELLLSPYEDWQYVESVKCQAEVLCYADFCLLEARERKAEGRFLSRSRMAGGLGRVEPLPTKACPCWSFYEPAEVLESCCLCGGSFHPEDSTKLCADCLPD